MDNQLIEENQFSFFRGFMIGIALSIPLWVAIFIGIKALTKLFS